MESTQETIKWWSEATPDLLNVLELIEVSTTKEQLGGLKDETNCEKRRHSS